MGFLGRWGGGKREDVPFKELWALPAIFLLSGLRGKEKRRGIDGWNGKDYN